MTNRQPDLSSLAQKLEHELELLEGSLRRLRLSWLLRHFPPRQIWAGFVCVNSFVAIALLSTVAMVSRSPFVFPSLGPTAYLLFFTPRAAAASPKHAICGHAIGLACGWAALWFSGLYHAPAVTAEGVNLTRVFAAAGSLGATGALMVLCNVGHPPAGATTLIVSLGFITRIEYLLIIEAAVLALVLHALVMNRLSGIDYPLWSPRRHWAPLPRPPVD
ncbi:MAG TPA: HPP family protein [Tepidisphaeraceae bacterium]|nr:HPP family protein [Tepidisphaeraceae bacterium]